MIDLAILGLLREQDLHGYELRKQASELAGLRPALSFGALYPALARLEAAGAVNALEAVPPRPRREPVLPADRLPVRRGRGLPRPARAERAARASTPRRGQGPEGVRHHRSGPSAARRPHRGSGHRRPGLPAQGGVLPLPALAPPTRAVRAAPGHPRRPPGRGAVQPAPTSVTAADRLDRYLRSLREHDNQTIQHDIAWLDELIASERAALDATTAGREEDSTP